MDVKAILLVGGADSSREQIGGLPIAMLDVLGEPILQRVLAPIEKLGVTSVAVISEVSTTALPSLRASMRPDIKWVEAKDDLWRAAELQFNEFAQKGAELVLFVRVGPYAELDFEEFVQFHLDRNARVTCAIDSEGCLLDRVVVNSARRNDTAHLLRNRLQRMRTDSENYVVTGYVNRLRDADDLRRLGMDGFSQINAIRPAGTEIKPGVWVGERTRIHRTARVLAPAYIGAGTCVRADAVLTRGAIVEHHSEIDCGTVIENSTVLPYSYVGAGLDVAKSVVGFREVFSIKRNSGVEIFDGRLVDMLVTTASMRVVKSAVGLVTLFPRLLMRGVFRRPKAYERESIPALGASSSGLPSQVSEDGSHSVQLAAEFMTARRYGDE